MLKYRVLRRILRFKREKVRGEWRKLCNEELNDLSSPPYIVWVIKSRSMRWAGHVAHTRGGEVNTGVWWGKLRERDHLDGRTILRLIFRKWGVGAWTGSSWLRIGTRGGHL